MIESFVRPLNRVEKSRLRREVKSAGEQRKKWFWFCLGALVLVMVIGIPLALNQGREDSALGSLAFGALAQLELPDENFTLLKDSFREVKATFLATRAIV